MDKRIKQIFVTLALIGICISTQVSANGRHFQTFQDVVSLEYNASACISRNNVTLDDFEQELVRIFNFKPFEEFVETVISFVQNVTEQQQVDRREFMRVAMLTKLLMDTATHSEKVEMAFPTTIRNIVWKGNHSCTIQSKLNKEFLCKDDASENSANIYTLKDQKDYTCFWNLRIDRTNEFTIVDVVKHMMICDKYKDLDTKGSISASTNCDKKGWMIIPADNGQYVQFENWDTKHTIAVGQNYNGVGHHPITWKASNFDCADWERSLWSVDCN